VTRPVFSLSDAVAANSMQRATSPKGNKIVKQYIHQKKNSRSLKDKAEKEFTVKIIRSDKD